jgi:hypothetical protein
VDSNRHRDSSRQASYSEKKMEIVKKQRNFEELRQVITLTVRLTVARHHNMLMQQMIDLD